MYCEHDSSWWEETEDGVFYCNQCDSAVCPECAAHWVPVGDDGYAPYCNCDGHDETRHWVIPDDASCEVRD